MSALLDCSTVCQIEPSPSGCHPVKVEIHSEHGW